MAGYNVSVYLEEPELWAMFKQACTLHGKRPDTVISNFIEVYSQETLQTEMPLEYRIAKGMTEAKNIVSGQVTAKSAESLFDEI